MKITKNFNAKQDHEAQGLCKNCGPVKVPHNCPHNDNEEKMEYVTIRWGRGGI